MADRFNMSDVMISYSRRDKPFVQQLEQALSEDGLEIWVDWEDIPPTADWWQEIQAGIEAAHTFIFIITPASVNSSICTREIEHAMQHHKRLIPVLHKELSPEDMAKMHPSLSTHNWIYFREDDHFRRAFLMLRSALETDLDHNKLHTRLLVRAREWEERGHSWSLLLRGDDLRQAENWLTRAIAGQTPQPTERQIDYIRASTRASRRLTQRLIGSAITALLLIVAGMVFALSQSEYAQVETNRALREAQLRSTQEWLANAGLAQAATAQRIAEDSAAAAATAQAQVLLAQTQEHEALQNAGNSQTQAAIAQDSAITATVLQGRANELAATARGEQESAEASADDAEQQAQEAQQEVQIAQEQAQEAQRQGALLAAAANAQVAEVQATATQIQQEAEEIQQSAQATMTQAARQEQIEQEQATVIFARILPPLQTAQANLDAISATATKFFLDNIAVVNDMAANEMAATESQSVWSGSAAVRNAQQGYRATVIVAATATTQRIDCTFARAC